jgi:hypothetical protein
VRADGVGDGAAVVADVDHVAAALATFLPRAEYSLLMMCFGMFVYVQLNLRWTLRRHHIEDYAETEKAA